MSAKYSRLPAGDPELGQSVSLDFGSAFSFTSPSPDIGTKKYKSIFSYSGESYPMDQSISVGKYIMLTCPCNVHLLYSEIGGNRGIHYFHIFALNIDFGYSLVPPR